MKIAYVNQSKPSGKEPRTHTCNVCDKLFIWQDDSCYAERFVGSGYKGYEIQFKVCGNECRSDEVARPKFIDWLSGYHGWTRQSALDNYNNYITLTTPTNNE